MLEPHDLWNLEHDPRFQEPSLEEVREKSMKDLGDRMKSNYENRARYYLTRRTPVIIRVDGRAFHTFTRRFTRPFDPDIEAGMDAVLYALCSELQGVKAGYVQSDEVSVVLTDWDDLGTESWFDYNLAKLISISASIATVDFNQVLLARQPVMMAEAKWAQFDSRAFNIPESEVTNYFLWRAKDWHRNSVTMYAQSVFSHRELHGKKVPDMHEMLHEKGLNWTTDLTDRQKNGKLVYRVGGGWRETCEIEPRYDDFNVRLVAALHTVGDNDDG